MDNQIRTCKNCKYFLAHYIKTEKGFQKTFYGHCINCKNARLVKDYLCKVCDCWQEKTVNEPQDISLGKTLTKLANEIKNIAKII